MMRILFDARSVRTPSSRYILHGLTTGWQRDPRVSQVIIAVRRGFDTSLLPDGVEGITLPGGNWAAHLLSELPRLADECLADLIFCPNGLAPRDTRAVLYFQDMFHFRLDGGAPKPTQEWLKNRARASWRQLSSDSWKLAVSVSQQVLHEVEKRVRIPSVVVPNGVDVGDSWWTGDGDHVFVLGGIGPRKDEQTAVRAWLRVPHELRRGLVLRIGGVEPEPRRATLHALVNSLGLADQVCITGTLKRADYLEQICRARIVISCSRLEAFSLPVAEAVAMGAPLLCTRIGSHMELLANAGVGTAFAPRDDADLAVRLGEALSGALPPRLLAPPVGWSWEHRAREHVDAYERYA
ncbi:MAG: glycosyltransferase [Gemmatimonadaceae bacterium]